MAHLNLRIILLVIFVASSTRVFSGQQGQVFLTGSKSAKSEAQVKMEFIEAYRRLQESNATSLAAERKRRETVFDEAKNHLGEQSSKLDEFQFIRNEADLYAFKKYIETARHEGNITKDQRQSLDELEQSTISMFVLQQQQIATQEGLLRLAKPIGLKDIFIRGFAGDNWKAIKDYNPETITDAIAAGTLFSSAGVMNKRFEKAIDRSLGGMLDTLIYGSYRSVSYYVKEFYYSTRNYITGHSGRPLEVEEVRCWQESVNMILRSLLKTAKEANMMGSRFNEKVLRDGDDSADEASGEWMIILASDVAELCYIAQSIEQSIAFYNINSDRSIIHYGHQLNNLLIGIKSTVLEKTKSYRDLGTSDYKAALDRAQTSIDQYFKLLIRQLGTNDVASDAKSSTTSSSNSSVRYPDNRMGSSAF